MGATVHNRDEVIAVIRDAGLPYEVVPDILSLTFEEQVSYGRRAWPSARLRSDACVRRTNYSFDASIATPAL